MTLYSFAGGIGAGASSVTARTPHPKPPQDSVGIAAGRQIRQTPRTRMPLKIPLKMKDH